MQWAAAATAAACRGLSTCGHQLSWEPGKRRNGRAPARAAADGRSHPRLCQPRHGHGHSSGDVACRACHRPAQPVRCARGGRCSCLLVRGRPGARVRGGHREADWYCPCWLQELAWCQQHGPAAARLRRCLCRGRACRCLSRGRACPCLCRGRGCHRCGRCRRACCPPHHCGRCRQAPRGPAHRGSHSARHPARCCRRGWWARPLAWACGRPSCRCRPCRRPMRQRYRHHSCRRSKPCRHSKRSSECGWACRQCPAAQRGRSCRSSLCRRQGCWAQARRLAAWCCRRPAACRRC